MKQFTPVWVMPFLLTALPAWGQETDSLFFRPDSGSIPTVGQVLKDRPHFSRQQQPAEPFMQTRVQFTGDFLRRLNNPAGTVPTRSARIRSLFDNEDPRFIRRPSGEWSDYARQTDQFIQDICTAPERGLPTDLNEQLYAEVPGRLTGSHREYALTLYLKKHRTGLNWAWEIIGAETDLPLPAVDTTQGVAYPDSSAAFIAPNAHELNFMGLTTQLRAGCSLTPFMSAAATADPTLKAISAGLATGRLRQLVLLTTTLWLNTQRGWWLQLRQFNRDTDNNSGWLISDLCRVGGGCCPPVLGQYTIQNRAAIPKPK